MSARVVPEGDVRWNPNDTRAVLNVSVLDGIELSVAPHPDDPDHRLLRLVWRDAIASRYSALNDEGLEAHPLYSSGLAQLLWLGTVEGSDWELGGRIDTGRRHKHFIVTLKECVIEVLAADYDVVRGAAPSVDTL